MSGAFRLLLKRHLPTHAFPICRYVHSNHLKELVLSLHSRGLIQSISVPEKKRSYGNKVGKKRLYAEEFSKVFAEGNAHRDLPNPHQTESPSASGKKKSLEKNVGKQQPDAEDDSTASVKERAEVIVSSVDELLSKRPSFYCGFDPTADSLHIGHMFPIMALLHLQRSGYPVIALVGGATAQLGDPTGKDKDRQMSPAAAQLSNNSAAISKQLETLFANHARMYTEETGRNDLPACKILDNLQWYSNMTVDDFYTKVGSHVKIDHMLERAIVKSRLKSGAGMSYTEFVYQCFQAYDWLHLFQEHGCCGQLGGYDQLGNIEDGYAFVWKSLQDGPADRTKRPPLMGLTVPLLTSAAGEKLGKVAGNAVWLSAKTAQSPGGISLVPYLDGLGFADVTKFLKALTFIPKASIEQATEDQARKMLFSYLSRLLINV